MTGTVMNSLECIDCVVFSLVRHVSKLFIKMIHHGLAPAPPSHQDIDMKSKDSDSASSLADAAVSASGNATLANQPDSSSAQSRSFSWSPAIHILKGWKQAFNMESPPPNEQSPYAPPSPVQPLIFSVFPALISFSRNRLFLMASHTHIRLEGSDEYLSHFASTFFVGSLGINLKVSINLIKEWFAKATSYQLEICWLTAFDAPEPAAYVRLVEPDAIDMLPTSEPQPCSSPSPALVRPLRPVRFGVSEAVEFVERLHTLQPPFFVSTYLEHCVCNNAGTKLESGL